MEEVDPGYLKSFEASNRERKEARDRLFQMEEQWVAATFALYDYSARHAKEIAIKEGNFHFASDKVRSEFNRQLQHSKSLFDAYQAALQDAVKARQKDLKDLGYDK